MDYAVEEAARHSATAFAREIAEFWRRRLEARALGVYLLGSLAHGGFSSRYSDIDVGVVADGGLTPGDIDAMRQAADAVSKPHAAKLSLFWADRAFAAGRFPPLDRVDYLDHAVPLFERERVRPERPALSAIRAYLRGSPFASWMEKTREFAAADALLSADHKPYIRCLLYPARLLFSWSSGAMGSNDEAVWFLREEPPQGLDVDLIARALDCRHDAADPDVLFAERAKLLGQHTACARVLEA